MLKQREFWRENCLFQQELKTLRFSPEFSWKLGAAFSANSNMAAVILLSLIFPLVECRFEAC